MEYQQRLRDLREDADLTQKEIAELLQTTQQYYGQYELGKRELPIHQLIKLSQIYETTTDYILGLTDVR